MKKSLIKLVRILKRPKVLSIINLLAILVIVIGNLQYQVFCKPINWSIPILILTFFSIISLPLIEKYKPLSSVTGMLCGISFFVILYCIAFAGWLNLFSIPLVFLMGTGFFLLIPQFFLIQVLWKCVFKPKYPEIKKWFLIGGILPLLSIFTVIFKYNQSLTEIEKFKQSNYKELNKSYFTERILGAHFLYHTRICLYDGWRPPLHDPAFVIGLWSTNFYDPLDVSVSKQVELYRNIYPERKVKLECSCAKEYSMSYHNSELWSW